MLTLCSCCRTSISSKRAPHGRQKMFSQSDDRIFEHPEVTIKPLSGDDKSPRRSMISARMFDTNENNGGSVPNMLEHPDMKTPLVMQTQQVSSSSESSNNSSMNDSQKFLRQQSGKNEPLDCAHISHPLCLRSSRSPLNTSWSHITYSSARTCNGYGAWPFGYGIRGLEIKLF